MTAADTEPGGIVLPLFLPGDEPTEDDNPPRVWRCPCGMLWLDAAAMTTCPRCNTTSQETA